MSRQEERWRSIDSIFEQALELSVAERPAFVAQAAEGDQEILETLERLLASVEEQELPGVSADPLDASLAKVREVALEELASGDEVTPGARIGRYRVVREVGRGGMSVVYLAERADGEFEQSVALKLIKRGIDTDEVVRRFHQERQILALLRHPNIAQLLDGGTTSDGRPYFVLELVEGRPIDRYCDEERLTIRQRLELFLKAARAVSHAHRSLVVHRDIKPSNLLVLENGEPKLLDFGIAKVLDSSPIGAAVTRTRGRLMTPAYASPEQVRGEALTTASDLYQLGLLLYLLLTGRWPYSLSGDHHDRIAKAICDDEPTRPSTAISGSLVLHPLALPTGLTDSLTSDRVSALRSTTPARLRRELAGDLDNILLTALRKEPERRYPSVTQLIDDVERVLDGRPISARPSTFSYRAGKWIRRHAVTAATAATALLLLIGGGTAYTLSLAQERDRATSAAEEAREVSSFLTGLFEVAAPTRSRGEQVTARQILDRGAEWINNAAEGQPSLRSAMMTQIGGVYRELAHYDEASRLLERAVALRRKTSQSTPLPLAEALDSLARVRRETAQFEQSITLFEEALAIRRAELGPDHPAVAETLAGLGQAFSGRGRYEEAQQSLNEALGIQERHFGSEDPRLGVTLHSLAMVSRQSHQHLEAVELLERGVALLVRGHEPDHPPRVTAEADLANLLTQMHETDRAQAMYGRLLPILERLYDGEHPELARRLGDYAFLLSSIGDIDGAVATHQRASQMIEDTLGADHPRFADSLNDLGLCYRELGDHAVAADYFERSAHISEGALGSNHPRTAVALLNLANASEKLGERHRAVALYERAIMLRDQAFGREHQGTLVPLVKLGRLHLALDDPHAAEPVLRRAHVLARQISPEGIHGVSTAQIALGRCLALLGQFEEAALLLEEMRPLFKEGHPEIQKRLRAALALVR